MMKSRLLLYLDVNQTITVVDTAAGKTLSDGINCAIARAAWVRHMSDGPLAEHTVPPFTDFRWHDGSPVLRDNQDGATTVPPPLVKYGGPDRAHTVEPFSFLDAAPPGCLCYYDVFGKELSKRFTLEGPGVLYRALHDKLLEMLEWPDGVPYTDELVTDHNGKKYHIVVPSLFNLLIHLQAQDRDFKIILSTMGHNIRTPAAVFELFAQHKHPVFTEAAKGLNFDHLRCLDNVHWSLHVNSGGPSRPSKYLLQGRSEQEKMESEEAIYSFMTADTHACGTTTLPVPCFRFAMSGADIVAAASRGAELFSTVGGPGVLGEQPGPLLRERPMHLLSVRWAVLTWVGRRQAAAGKRLWFTADDHAVHPILFDDNIKKSEDSESAHSLKPSARKLTLWTVCAPDVCFLGLALGLLSGRGAHTHSH
eukprot:1275315-Rhodomonas_salina.1